jgi:hypothetical protein
MGKSTSRPCVAVVTSLALAGALLFWLAGCASVPTAPQVGSSSPASPPLLFTSDAEALAAATAAYSKYLEVSDQIARDGGANPERLKPFVSPELFVTEAASFEKLQQRGLRGTGSSSFSNSRVQSSGTSTFIYLCLDTSKTALLNSQGVDVSPATSKVKWPLVIEVTRPVGLEVGVVNTSETWSGTNFCS